MKIKAIALSLISSLMFGAAVAQGVEYDDMYFNSKDRAKLKAEQEAAQLSAMASIKKAKKQEQLESNPTDSYSARNQNPEFASRSVSRTAAQDDQNYFVNNYRFNSAQGYNNWYNNFNNWYSNPWYRTSWYNSYMSGWNSPYYGYYDAWNSPWYDPYYANGFSSSFSYYYGNTWNYGWGGSYNYWNRPYCPFNSYYGYGAGYNSNWYWNNYRNPVIITNGSDAGKGIAYGKRPSRGSSFVNGNVDNRSRSNSYISSGRDDNNSGGRISSNRQQTEYYNRTWRNGATTNTGATYDSRTSTQQNRSSSWSTNSSNNNSNYSNNSTYTPSRSSSNDSGGTRSHSPSSTGSGSNGRSRGRD